MMLGWVKVVFCWAGILIGVTAANAAECPGNQSANGARRIISIDLTQHAKHARLGCIQKYSKSSVRRHGHRIAQQAKVRLPSLRAATSGKPVLKGGGAYRVGNPYMIAGRTYTPQADPNYRAEGQASWYGKEFHGRLTANGERFDVHALSAAHPTLPLPSYVRVTNLQNRRSLVVRLNDRGPYHGHRLIDVSGQAAMLLGFYDQGIAQVRVEYLGRAELAGSDDDRLAATLRNDDPSEVQVAANESVQPDSSKPSPVDRELTQSQCDLPRPATLSSQPVSFTGNRDDGANCKPTNFEIKVAVSWLSAFRQNSYSSAIHTLIDALPF